MRLILLTLITLQISLTASFAQQSSAAIQEREAIDQDIENQIERVENGLPAITQNGDTLKYSLTEWMEKLAIPGMSIAVIDDYEIVWAKGYGGTKKSSGKLPITAETIFQAGSIAKPVTALGVLHYVDRGTFDLDADINSYLNSWILPDSNVASKREVTIRELLAHSGGITPGGFGGYGRTETLPDILQILCGKSPARNNPAEIVEEPGNGVMYSGLGYTILQLALEEQLNKPFEKIMKENVLGPLELNNSVFKQDLPDDFTSKVALGHYYMGDIIQGGWDQYPEMAAAGLWSTPTDLSKLIIEVAKSKSGESNQILSTEITKLMLATHKDHMGLGFIVKPDQSGYFAHAGLNNGYYSYFEMYANKGTGAVIMTNSNNGQLIWNLIFTSLAREYGWPDANERSITDSSTQRLFEQIINVESPRVKIEVDPAILSKYTGTYELAPGFNFVITFDRYQLRMKLGDQRQLDLYAESKTKFFTQAVDAQLSFVTDDEGQTTSLILHQNNQQTKAKKIQ